MVKSNSSCDPSSSRRKKSWPYDEYYFGERDNEDRRNGQGENHWTGAEVTLITYLIAVLYILNIKFFLQQHFYFILYGTYIYIHNRT